MLRWSCLIKMSCILRIGTVCIMHFYILDRIVIKRFYKQNIHRCTQLLYALNCPSSLLSGILITPFMTYGFIKSKNVDEEGLKDRCYRLRYNKKQLLIDRMVFYSSIMGWLFMRWPGVVYATNISVIAGTIYNVSWSTKNL